MCIRDSLSAADTLQNYKNLSALQHRLHKYEETEKLYSLLPHNDYISLCEILISSIDFSMFDVLKTHYWTLSLELLQNLNYSCHHIMSLFSLYILELGHFDLDSFIWFDIPN